MTQVTYPRLAILAFVGLVVLALAQSEPVTGQETEGIHMIRVEGEGAQYWPRWRGPSGQGLVDGNDYPDTWSDTENVMWKTPVPGSGNSSRSSGTIVYF